MHVHVDCEDAKGTVLDSTDRLGRCCFQAPFDNHPRFSIADLFRRRSPTPQYFGKAQRATPIDRITVAAPADRATAAASRSPLCAPRPRRRRHAPAPQSASRLTRVRPRGACARFAAPPPSAPRPRSRQPRSEWPEDERRAPSYGRREADPRERQSHPSGRPTAARRRQPAFDNRSDQVGTRPCRRAALRRTPFTCC